MNARNFLFIRKNNSRTAKLIADNKLETKRFLIRNNIPTTKLIKIFRGRESIKSFDWQLPENGFAIKPARGYGGEGIIVFRNWQTRFGETITGKYYTRRQLESHIFDIFDGVHSLQSLPDVAFVEERITPHPFFKKITSLGLPDIRIIVYRRVPVMAMLRVPTFESKGKANLHLGAIGAGIDITTGITNHAIYKNKPIDYFPGTKIKIRGLRIPSWNEILTLAIKSQIASRLGYAGIDIVIDQKSGPMVLEINARPGLGIQTANLDSLRLRMERIENLNVNSIEHGIEIAKSLYAESFSHKVKDAQKILSVIEPITINTNGIRRTIQAKLDSGAFRTSLDQNLVRSLNLPVLPRKILIKSASGQQLRPAVQIDFDLAGKRITTIATIANRSHLRYPIIVGRKDLGGFLINPQLAKQTEEQIQTEDKIE